MTARRALVALSFVVAALVGAAGGLLYCVADVTAVAERAEGLVAE